MRKRTLLAGMGVAVGLSAALAVWLSGRLDAPAAPTRPVAGPPRVVFQPGARQAYRLRVESWLRLSRGWTGAPGTIRQTVAGTLHLRVLEADPEGAHVALQLGGASLSLGGRSSEDLDRQLGAVFLATFAADGAPTRFEFPRAIGREARMLLEEAVRTFQVIVPPGAGASWSVEETHASGRYRASYRAAADGRILKTKLAYLDPEGEGGSGVRVTVRRADATIRIDPGSSWLERMVDDEELAVSIGGGAFTTSSLRAELTRVPVETAALAIDDAPGSWGELAAALASEGPAPVSRGWQGEERHTLSEVVRGLDAASGRSVALLYDLRDLLVRNPEAADRVLAHLRAGVQDGTAAALLNALGMAATDEAQAVLRAVIEDPAFGRVNRARAALSLGGATEIGDDSVAALRKLADGGRADGLANTALLSLGMAGDRLRRLGSEHYAEVQADLVRRVDVARDGSEAAAAILALGNTHDPALAEEAAAHLGDASPAVRSAAAHALAKLGGGADPDALARRLSVETHEAVRSTIAASLNALPPPSAATLALVNEAIRRESNPDARYEMARLLGENLETYREAQATLAALARTDPSRRVRTYAAHAAWGRTR